MHSITHRLVVLVLLSELLLTLAVTSVTLEYERSQRYKAFDVMLRGRADSVFSAVQIEDETDRPFLNTHAIDVPATDMFEVRLDSGPELGRSANWQQPSRSTPMQPGSVARFRIGRQKYRYVFVHGSRSVEIGDRPPAIDIGITVFYASPTAPVRDALLHASEFLVAANLLVLLLSGLLATALVRRGMQPLQDLAIAAGSITANSWTFHAPPSAQSLRELSGLAQALQITLQGLERSFRQQQNFVHDAAHELKTAVTIIKSSLQLLNYKDRNAFEYRHGVDASLADCGRMEELVQKMLTLARVEQQAAHGVMQHGHRTNVGDCIRQTLMQVSPVAELRGVSIASSLPPDMTSTMSEEDWGILVSNLVMNAIQHSNRNSSVIVEAAAHVGGIQLTVRDFGQGIPRDRVPYVFDRFYRGDPSRARNTGGTGLGLAICKALVGAHHGQITIESEEANGTTVSVMLPGDAA